MYTWGGRRHSRQVSWSDQKDYSWLCTNPVHLLLSIVSATHSFIQANSLHILYSFLPFYQSAFWFTPSHQSWHSPDFSELAQATKIYLKDRKLGTSYGVQHPASSCPLASFFQQQKFQHWYKRDNIQWEGKRRKEQGTVEISTVMALETSHKLPKSKITEKKCKFSKL